MTKAPSPDLADGHGAADEEDDLENRYGRTPRSGMPRWWWLAIGALTVGIVALWALTSLSPAATVEFQTAGFAIEDANHAHLDARVSVQPGTELACAVEAKNDRDAMVGWKVVTVPASAEAHQLVSVPIVTTREAASVAIRECWVLHPSS